jgi:ornithine carbamoyltransferase
MQSEILKKDLLSISDIGPELESIIHFAQRLKDPTVSREYANSLAGKSMAMLFEKSSTRTRVSFEVAMTQLGGHGLFLSTENLQVSRGETVADTARVLSRYVDLIMYRSFSHQTMKDLAMYARVPVINALDDLEHPCQIVADLLTILEHKSSFQDLKFTYLGDGNNVCNSLLLGTALSGMDMRVGCPKGYSPDENILNISMKIAAENNCTINVTNDPMEAIIDCDVIYTDTWVSMGDESEAEKRREIFKPYQVNSDLVASAKQDYIFMHCLPAHRGDEVTDEIMESSHSVIYDQAENRLHAQKAIILYLLNLMK